MNIFDNLERSFFHDDISDEMIYNDETLYMTYSPLGNYPTEQTLMWDIIIDRFNNPVLHCKRGYIAKWQIIDNKLHLINIEGGKMTVRNREHFLKSRRELKHKLHDGIVTHKEYPNLKVCMTIDSMEEMDVNFSNLSLTGEPIFMDRFTGCICMGMGITIDKYNIVIQDKYPVVDFNGPLTPRGFILGYRGPYRDGYNYIIGRLLYEKYITLTFENGIIVDTKIEQTTDECIEVLCGPPLQQKGESDIIYKARLIVWKHNYDIYVHKKLHTGYGSCI